jgi:hypothetical protein
MAQTGFTPILLYASSTPTNAPSAGNLTNSATGSELAINIADKNLFFKDSTNVVNTVPIRQSGTSSNGWLSSTDWNTFNGKAPSFTYTTGYIPFGQGTTTPNQSANLFWDNANIRLGVGVSAPLQALHVSRAGPSTYTLITNTGTGPSNLFLGAANAQTQIISRDGTTGAVPLNVLTGSTQVAQFGASDFTVNVGNVVIGTSGKGIDFSATPGTGTSELLADYEEGTWTPSQGSGLTVVGTFSSSGSYTKIGNTVRLNGVISATTSVAIGVGVILTDNLPFTPQTGSTGSMSAADFNTNTVVRTANNFIYNAGSQPATTSLTFSIVYRV